MNSPFKDSMGDARAIPGKSLDPSVPVMGGASSAGISSPFMNPHTSDSGNVSLPQGESIVDMKPGPLVTPFSASIKNEK